VRESDGLIPVGLASERVTNSSERCTASSVVNRAEHVQTLYQVRPDSLH